MCFFGSSKAPSLPAAPPPPPPVPTERVADPNVGRAQEEERRRLRSQAAKNETILTSPLGVQNGVQGTQKTLLGQ